MENIKKNIRIGALDISKNRIGIAFSDPTKIFVSFTKILHIKGNKKWKEELKEIFKNHNPAITYVGLPYKLDHNASDTTNYVKIFTHGIRNIIGKYEFVDERFSTNIALMYGNQTDDIVARMLVYYRLNVNNFVLLN